jgi:hypothetical protein
MEYIGLFVLVIIIGSIISGIHNMRRLELAIEFNLFNSPCFNLGVSFNEYYVPEYIEQELLIGLFFINISLIFYKDGEESGV